MQVGEYYTSSVIVHVMHCVMHYVMHYIMHYVMHYVMQVGEYYTSGVIAQMIEEGHAFEAVQIDPSRFHVLGTPTQLVDWCAGRNDQVRRQS